MWNQNDRAYGIRIITYVDRMRECFDCPSTKLLWTHLFEANLISHEVRYQYPFEEISQ